MLKCLLIYFDENCPEAALTCAGAGAGARDFSRITKSGVAQPSIW